MSHFIMLDAFAEPFRTHGLACGERGRLPEALIPSLRPQLHRLARMTSGGRIRFVTDAPQLRIEAVLAEASLKTNMTLLLHSGFDLCEGTGPAARHIAAVRPAAQGDVPFEPLDGFTVDRILNQTVALPGGKRLYTLYLPVFCALEKLSIGFPEGYAAEPAPDYTVALPVVFYGSSITQGACASRPSLTYPARVCRMLDSDFINLGFAGQGRGDPAIAEYIASLPMKALVMDYDHNAPDAQWLGDTHWRFYEQAVEKSPQTPVLFMSRIRPALINDDEQLRAECRQAVEKSYSRAIGERGIHAGFLNGSEVFGALPDECLTDMLHPNDAGFEKIAACVLPMLQALLQ